MTIDIDFVFDVLESAGRVAGCTVSAPPRTSFIDARRREVTVPPPRLGTAPAAAAVAARVSWAAPGCKSYSRRRGRGRGSSTWPGSVSVLGPGLRVRSEGQGQGEGQAGLG
eukprot:scaffold105432_cov69-Phaeocystis_antarctica.AAC.2